MPAIELPFDIIYLIRSFLKWRERTKMISREWLRGALRQRVRLTTWRDKVRMATYMKVFGQMFAQLSWHSFCMKLSMTRRSRNVHYRLTWKAAGMRYLRTHCKSCGRPTRASVMGMPICLRCRENPRRKYAFMVMVCQAKRMGIPKRILDMIPYHTQGQKKLRFHHAILSVSLR